MVNLLSFFLVFIGGGLGSLFRFGIGIMVLNNFKPYFPVGTFLVNIIGCFLLGLIIGLVQSRKMVSQEFSLLFGTGFCGGFTTFSAFSIEANSLMKDGEWAIFGGYVVGSIGFGVLSTLIGLRITK
jgi:fluoride exporter